MGFTGFFSPPSGGTQGPLPLSPLPAGSSDARSEAREARRLDGAGAWELSPLEVHLVVAGSEV